MSFLIIDPSPLSNNVYRLLCRRWEQMPCLSCDTLDEIDPDWLKRQNQLVAVIGGGALRGDGKRFLTTLAETAPWQQMAKVIVVPHDATPDELSSWQQLPNLKLLARPFAPDDFYAIVSPMLAK